MERMKLVSIRAKEVNRKFNGRVERSDFEGGQNIIDMEYGVLCANKKMS